MTELISRKKEAKRRRLLDAAYDLFAAKGISQTSIAEICSAAQIAKGTFYLYFKDKEDILRALTTRLSASMLESAYHQIEENDQGFVENAVTMADYLMDLFKNDPDTVSLMKKDFVWPITEAEFMVSDMPVMKIIRKGIHEHAQATGISDHQILIRLYAMISMICSISYSSIIDHFPSEIDDLKPEVFAMIRKAF